MFDKTEVAHLKRMGNTHGISCKICMFKKAWGYGMEELDRSLRLEKAIKKHRKQVVALGEPAHHDEELYKEVSE